MRLLVILALCTVPAILFGHAAPGPEPVMTGAESLYSVVAGDTLTSIGARYGVEAAVLARRNGLRASQRLTVGQVLTIDNRHLVPTVTSESLVINIPQRMLFQFRDGALFASYPVGLGRPTWPTPLGAFTVLAREENPTWRVPPSIQDEMRREGKPVITIMPPCPANPLGQYRLTLSLPGIGIHGTIAPASIYQFQTHGCIRLNPDDICALFANVSVGDTGRILYQPALLARLGDGRVFAEVHRDIYRRGPDAAVTLRAETERLQLAADVDWQRLAEVVHDREGLAVDVSHPRLTRKDPQLLRNFPEIPTGIVAAAHSESRQVSPPRQPPLVIRSMAGPDLFLFYCATCHGPEGRGNGPVAPALKTPPADLTVIAQHHQGVFPRARVEQFITNDRPLLASAHGTKEMPVWGPIFHALDPSDARVKVRIANLVDYIQSIQVK